MTFAELSSCRGRLVYVSATPADWELMKSEGVVVEQLIRSTAWWTRRWRSCVTANQIDDLIEEIDKRVKNDDKVLRHDHHQAGGREPTNTSTAWASATATSTGRRYARAHPDPRDLRADAWTCWWA